MVIFYFHYFLLLLLLLLLLLHYHSYYLPWEELLGATIPGNLFYYTMQVLSFSGS